MGLEFEEYKEIFPSYYISNFGNIKHDNNFLKKCIHSNGYEQVNIRIGNKYVTKLIHRLVAAAFIPNPDNNHVLTISTAIRGIIMFQICVGLHQ